MSSTTQCPACGETDALSGTQTDDGIEIVCQTCGAAWLRGASRCKGCGRADSVTRAQIMTRHTRGNQLAIIGRREILLCPSCDAATMEASANAPVPDTYVSVFLFGDTTLPAVQPRPQAPAPATRRKEKPPGPSATSTPATPSTGPAHSARQAATKPAPIPTVRQAIQSYLTADSSADSLTMLLLGQHLGPSERLSALDTPERAARLSSWFAATWGNQPAASRDSARRTLDRAFEHWRDHSWLTTHPTSELP